MGYYNDPGIPSNADGICAVCEEPYHYGSRIAKATPQYWRGKLRMAHLECALRVRQAGQ